MNVRGGGRGGEAGAKIDAAAAVLTKKAYPFMKQVPWGSDEFLLTPGKTDPIGWAKAVGKIIDMGASMDSGLVKEGCEAHAAAITGMAGREGVCSETELTHMLPPSQAWQA